MSSSHYSVRFVQTRKKEKKITIEEYLDVKRACHRWLMKNNPNYRRSQEELPARMKYKDWDSMDDTENVTTWKSKSEK
mgnify:CR=1 FL=1